ncbi:MAG: hypothetical protein A2Z03_06635 [Chloroflexi bacterium RBG_16_56_8]|nr:MAG: hypothetical protein A2Z03_06635 [Chloroflexi bacterium RBG_16_56_8]
MNANTNLVKARDWIDQNLPAGAHVAVESNGPFIDSQNHVVETIGDLFAHGPDWYEKNGWEYLVTGYRNTNLLAGIPVVSSAPPRDYRDFFSGFSLVAHVAENGHEIWIFKTGAILPERRVYARWGVNNAEWLELVGYDKSKSAALPGEPTTLTLYWRSILPRRDRLELTIHWLDSRDQDIAVSHQYVFPSVDATGRWPDGITRVPVQIALPETTPPGLYRVELELAAPDTLGKGNIPVLSREQKPISDKFYIGPFKVAPPTPSLHSVGMRDLNARFGDTLDLRSYSLKYDAVRPGETVTIKLLWQSIAKTGKDYTVFVHLLDASGNVRAQVDTPPLKGTYPTSIWDSGELVEDEYTLMLPDNLPLGHYKIEVGLYEYPSLARLPVIDSEAKGSADHLLLPDTIKVTAP